MRTLTIGSSNIDVPSLAEGSVAGRCCDYMVGLATGSIYVKLDGMSPSEPPQELRLGANIERHVHVRTIINTEDAGTPSDGIKVELHWT